MPDAHRAASLTVLLLCLPVAVTAQMTRSHMTVAATVHDLVLIPAGTFTMGSAGGKPDEQPPHRVFLNDYFIDRFEVTNRLYVAFLNDGGRHVDVEGRAFVDVRDPDAGIRRTRSGDYRVSLDALADSPAGEISWLGAYAYCRWAGLRLPSEAMWEKAARGTDERTYPWGEEISRDRANYGKEGCCGGDSADGFFTSSPVSEYDLGISPYGVHDMAGNVWEFVSDWYGESYYAMSPASHPEGPATGLNRVLRGGSFGSESRRLRTTDRSGLPETLTYRQIGFRCAAIASTLPATVVAPESWGRLKATFSTESAQ